MTDLVERLKRPVMFYYDSRPVNAERREAATALEAKDKELAECRSDCAATCNSYLSRAVAAEARAETAERIVIASWNAFGGTQVTNIKEADELAVAAEGDLDEQIKTLVTQCETAEREREDQKSRADINYDLFVDAERNRAESIIVVNLLRRERDDARAALKALYQDTAPSNDFRPDSRSARAARTVIEQGE